MFPSSTLTQEGDCFLAPPLTQEGDCFLAPPLTQEGDCFLAPPLTQEGDCFLAPPLTQEGDCFLASEGIAPPPPQTGGRQEGEGDCYVAHAQGQPRLEFPIKINRKCDVGGIKMRGRTVLS